MENHRLLPAALLLAATAVRLLLPSSNGGVAEAQSLCFSQFALANEACRFIQATTAAASEPQESTPGSAGNYTSQKPPVATGRDQRQGDDPRDSACCRRLSSVDDACVCQALSRLPRFISGPRHVLTLSPVHGCDVTFRCNGTSI